MANIKSFNGQTLVQVTGHKVDDMHMTRDDLVHLTLTLTSDGRLLKKVTFKWQGKGHYGGGGYKAIGKTDPAKLAEIPRDVLIKRLQGIARKMGYEVD